MNDHNNKTEEEYKKKLGDERYHILREGGTEPPFSGEYYTNKDDGMYHCGACDALLFSSTAKFDSKTGWPSFDEPTVAGAVTLIDDDSLGMRRVEVRCKACGSHLGHVFDDGPTKTGKRFCINSCALDFSKKDSHYGV
ncbi:MAG: peptide-methionine (R)-S-oxide reductase MsrB [bacterium]|nr:peptide-methionine (R)-S-oxide reductase MsrB [bacterium]